MSPFLFALVDAVYWARYQRALLAWQLGGRLPAGKRKALGTRRTRELKRLGWWRSTWGGV